MKSSGPSDSMRSNLGILEGQSDQMPSDEAFSSLLPPQTQYNNVHLLGHDEMDMPMELLTHQSDNHMPMDQQNPLHLQPMQQLSASLITQPQPQQQFHPEESMFLHQQQQQRFLQWKRYFSIDAAVAQLNQMQEQQRLLEMKHYQNSLRALQRSQMQHQHHSPNLPMRSPRRPVSVEMCERRIAQYMIYQKHRPQDNNIEFWRKFVKEFFAPNAKKVWCVSLYGKVPPTTGLYPQRKPGRGFEASFDCLPRLFKIKYESGIVEERLYIDSPHGLYSPSGQIILTYSTAVQHSVYEQLRLVRYGQLRIVFSPDLKIRSWEFCAVKHEEVIPRRLLTSQVRHLANAVQKYQASAKNNAASNLSASDLESSCTMFMESAAGVAKTLQGPLLNELGYGKRYVQCLQIAEVVESMKGVIDFSLCTGASPLESLAMLWRRTNNTSSGQNQEPEEGQRQQQQQQRQQAETSNDVAIVNNTSQSQDPADNQNCHEYPLQNVWKPAS